MKQVNIDAKSLIIGILLAALVFLLTGAGSSQPTIKEYAINNYEESLNLENWVSEKIKEGWQPQGGLSISYVRYSDKSWGIHRAQAMVK